MSKLFYDHLVILDELFVDIELLDVTAQEKKQMKTMIEEIVHHEILTHILDLLPKEHHEPFLQQFHTAPYDRAHLKFIEDKIDRNISAEIVIVAQKVKSNIRHEIKKHKKKSKKQ